MWIETEAGSLWNIHEAGQIIIAKPEYTDSRDWEIWGDGLPLAAFKTRALAEAAKDRLKKWIATKGETPDGHGGHCIWRVFSFRTLSDEDEFKTRNP